MPRSRRRPTYSRLAYFQPDLETFLIDDAAEAVAAYRIAAAELPAVHVPELHASDARICLPYLPDVLQRELLHGGLGQCNVLVILVVCLLAHAKQPA